MGRGFLMNQKKKFHSKMRWKKILFQVTWNIMPIVLACIIALSGVFTTVLPTIAMERTCNLPEHVHTDACYRAVPVEPEQSQSDELDDDTDVSNQEVMELICGYEEHMHTEACNIPNDVAPEENTEHEQNENTQDGAEDIPNEHTPNQDETTAPNQDEIAPPAGMPNEDENNPQEDDEHVSDAPSGEEQQETFDEIDGQMGVLEPPMPVEKYITNARLKYKQKKKNNEHWQDSTGATIPGDARLRLEIEYAQVPLDTLLASDGKLDFSISDVMRKPEAKGEVNGGTEAGNIGKIEVNQAKNILQIQFNKEWLEKLQQENQTQINGEFYVESDINLAVIPDSGKGKDIVCGDVILRPTFDDDIIAKYGEITIQKKVSDHVEGTDGAHYLDYTLTVQTKDDALPAIKVVDYFHINGHHATYENITATPKVLPDSTQDGQRPMEQIKAGVPHGKIYKGNIPSDNQTIPEPNQTITQEPGSIVWDIQNMEPNETRVLTYRVKLQQHQFMHENPLRNVAQVYSKTYKRDESTADFTPKIDLILQKSYETTKRNDNGTYTIPYTVRFSTSSENNHVLKNLRIVDSLHEKEHATNEKALQHITYDKNSFHLYRSENGVDTEIPIQQTGNQKPILQYADDGKSFTLSMGNVKAGESYYFQYNLHVDAAAFAEANLDKLTVKNRVLAFAENAKLPNQEYLKKYDALVDMGYQYWVNKSVGQILQSDKTIAITNPVYDATSGTIQPQPNPPQNFTVPKGSVPYTVVINDLGDFDVTKATIKDELKTQYLQYAGYLQINAYDTKQEPKQDGLGKLVESRWVYVQGLRTFNIQCSQVGFADNAYAYRLTYYAEPVNMGNINTVGATNVVHIGGPVGRNGKTFDNIDFASKAEVLVQGGHAFEVEKKAWYYEKANQTEGAWKNGEIFWGLKIDGTKLHQGSFIKDHAKYEVPNHQRGNLYFHKDAFVGMYLGHFEDGESFTDFGTLQSLLESNRFTPIAPSKYEVSYERVLEQTPENAYDEVIVKMLDSVDIPDGSSIYIIVKGEPSDLPTSQEHRDEKRYTNYVSTSDDGKVYQQRGQDTKVLYAGQNILKEFNRFVEFDGTEIKNIDGYAAHEIPIDLLKENGHFLAWSPKINYAGDLSGHYRVVDVVPEGTEVAFARIKWRGEKIRHQDNIVMRQIPNYETVLGEGWTEHHVVAGMDEVPKENRYTSYYYTKGNQVLWEVENMIAGHEKDHYAVDFQIVCRVTAPEVLLGGVNKEFINEIYLQTPNGNMLDSAANSAYANAANIDKEMVEDGNKMHYTITLNPNGENLLKDKDTITLVDEMSKTLRLDLESIKVFQTNGAQEAVPFTSSLQNNVLRIVLPDDMPLTITYTTSVQAIPNTTVTLSNKAYWEGYQEHGGDSVIIENFEYTVGGIAGSTSNPHVRVLKYDKDNFTHHLAGAEFVMEEGQMEHDIFVPNGRTWNSTSDATGIAVMGTGNTRMKFNTVYRIIETHAPDGYIKSDREYVFLVAAKENGAYPTYPENVFVYYNDPVFVLNVENQKKVEEEEKTQAFVRKKFQKVDGTPMAPIAGTYHFGLFAQADGTGEPLQVIDIVVDENTTDAQGVFLNLDKNKTYYVFELDDNKKPILQNGSEKVNDILFEVQYQSELEHAHAVTENTIVTVTNRVKPEHLPETGGTGKWQYILSGLFLMGMSSAMMYKKKRQQ